MDDFHHGGKIALFLEFARIDTDQIEQLIRVHQVEITGQSQVERRDRISFNKRVAELGIISALGAVPKVAQQQFSDKGYMSFHQTWVLSDIRLILFKLFHFPHNFGEDVGNRLMITAPDAMEKGVTGLYIQFDRRYSSSVLPTVVLFFHQQVQLIQAVQDSAVLLEIIRERLA
jgi:hypothetical protein